MADAPKQETKKSRALRVLSAMSTERSSWENDWKEISRYVHPRGGRFDTTDRNKGGKKRYGAILDNTAIRAKRVLAAGMQSGMTSPARPWMRLGLPDHDLMKRHAVKVWLHDTTQRMLRVFNKSNTYLTLHGMYEDLGSFGTAAAVLQKDFETLVHHYHSPVGEFSLAADYRGHVNTFGREFEKTVDEVVSEFGLENCSRTVRSMYDNSNYNQPVKLYHLIEPRRERDRSKKDARNKPFASCYFEPAGDPGDGKFLRESGYDRFPVLAPRWHRTGGDVYGLSPGMEAIGDVKQLQHEQLRKGNAIDYQTKPPLQGPASLKSRDIDQEPGGYTAVPSVGSQNAITTLYNVQIDLQTLLLDIQDVRQRIESAFYADLFLMLATADKTNMTATEVAERHEEKLLMLGPVLERLHIELLSPLIEETFALMVEVGYLSPPPEELQGADLEVEFVSMLAQAQRAIGVNGTDRWTASLGQLAAIKPEVLDRIDVDHWAEAYADMLGVDPEMLVAGEKAALVRQERAKQAQIAQQSANLETQANALAKAGTVKTDENNAGRDLLNMFSGYQSPPGTEL